MPADLDPITACRSLRTRSHLLKIELRQWMDWAKQAGDVDLESCVREVYAATENVYARTCELLTETEVGDAGE